MVLLALVLHLGNPITPALATDMLAFVLAAMADRWLVPSGVGVGLMLVVLASQPESWPTMAEYASIVPVAVAMLRGRPWLAGLFAFGYLVPLGVDAAANVGLSRTLLLWVTVYAATVAVTGLINQSRQARRVTTQQQLEEQRHSIARELHDTVAHDLSLISMHVQRLQISGDIKPEDLEFVLATCDSALSELRAMLIVLRSQEASGVEEEFARPLEEEFREGLSRLAAHGFTVDYRGDGSTADMTAAVGWALAGMCREAVSNIITHGDPGELVQVDLEVDEERGQTRLAFFNRVGDHGQDSQHVSLGLVGVRERVEAVGGQLYAYGSARQWVTMACVPNRGRRAVPVEVDAT